MLPVGQITAGGGADLLFWPISRGVLGEWVNGAGKIHRLRSLVAYQILFGGKLVIRDSDYLNSHALRAAINATLGRRPDADAKFFRALMDEGFLMIAKRQENSLGQVAEQLSRLGGSDRIDPKWYCSDAPDILYLETFHARTGLVVPFSVQDASSYYTDEIRRMLSASLQPYVDEDFRMRAATRVEDHLAEHEKLAWSFFTSDGEFWTGFSETDRRRYADFIYYVLGQAPHAGFIPDNIGIRAIYMQDAADAISIWRGRHLQTRELVDERTVPLGHGFSFSDYLEYLGRLPVDRLVSLAEGEEREEFRLTCSKFALEQVSLSDVTRAYGNYRAAVDASLLNSDNTLSPSGWRTELKAFARSTADCAVGAGLDIVARKLGVPLGPELVFFYQVVSGKWSNQHEQRVTREVTHAYDAKEIQRLQREGTHLGGDLVMDEQEGEVRAMRLEAKTGDIYAPTASSTVSQTISP
jgi:hypothetical protein